MPYTRFAKAHLAEASLFFALLLSSVAAQRFPPALSPPMRSGAVSSRPK
jgi:hypothetical protein